MQLARAGFDVGITFNSDEEGARGTAAEVEAHGRRAVVRRLDLSQLPDAAAVVDELAEELGGVDVLVNNSGIEPAGAVPRARVGGLAADAGRRPRRRVPLRAARPRGGWSRRAAAAGSSTSRRCTSTCRCPSRRRYVAAKHGLGGLTKQMALELRRARDHRQRGRAGRDRDADDGQGGRRPGGGRRAPMIPVGRPGDATRSRA